MRANVLVILLLSSACSGATTVDAGPDPSDAGVVMTADANVDAGADAGPTGLTWTSCAWVWDARPGEPNENAECAELEVPLDWDEPAGRTITIDVRRLPSPSPTVTDLFLLNGGPGGSAAGFERLMRSLSPSWRDVRPVLVDARGAGRSTRLGCSAEAADSPGSVSILTEEWESCLADVQSRWGEDLAHFNTTNTARDLLEVARLIREPDVSQIVYGASYGTYWVNRALQLDPHAFDAVVLDGIVNVADPDLTLIDRWHDEVTRSYLALCDLDEECSARLGGDAVAMVEDVLSRVTAGHCSELGDDFEQNNLLLRVAMGALISGSRARAAIPALMYRVDRCSPADVAAVEQVLTLIFGSAEGGPTEPDLFSIVLAHHVTLSELWASPAPSTETLQAIADAAIAHKNIGAQFGARQASWPTYEPDALHGIWATTDVPMLMMNGTLDPQTTIASARAAELAFAGPNQTFVEMPNVGHVTLTNSWTRPNATCAIALLTQFMRGPESTLDTSCVDDIDVLDFELTADYAQAFFGVDETWD